MSTGFFVTKSPEHTSASFVDTQPTVPQNDESSNVLQEETTEKSTGSELLPDALGGTEGEVFKDSNLEDQGETKVPPSLSISEDTNSEHVCGTDIRSEPPILEANIPVGDSSVVETIPALSDNLETHTVVEESPVLSHNSHSDVVEKPSLTLTKTEDHSREMSESPTVEGPNDFREDIVSPLSPSEDSLNNINYERPEDSEDDPDGLVSILRLRKESIRGEEMIQLQDLADSSDQCVVTLISRRSIYRAGQ